MIVEVLRGGRVVRRFPPTTRRAGTVHRLRLGSGGPAARRPPHTALTATVRQPPRLSREALDLTLGRAV